MSTTLTSKDSETFRKLCRPQTVARRADGTKKANCCDVLTAHENASSWVTLSQVYFVLSGVTSSARSLSNFTSCSGKGVDLVQILNNCFNKPIIAVSSCYPALAAAISSLLFQLRIAKRGKLYSSSFHMLHIMSLLAASLPLLLLFPNKLRAACYFPDGNISPSDVPSDASASESVCCFGG